MIFEFIDYSNEHHYNEILSKIICLINKYQYDINIDILFNNNCLIMKQI
jgi:hypothetical protein